MSISKAKARVTKKASTRSSIRPYERSSVATMIEVHVEITLYDIWVYESHGQQSS